MKYIPCPECTKLNQKSCVYFINSMGIGGDGLVDSYWDEEGKYHVHSKGFFGNNYRCSNGHTWSVKHYSKCETCGWTAEPKEEVLKRDIEELAKEIATKAHEGQTRWGGKPYITHPEAVVNILKSNTYNPPDKETLAVAWLHDTLEDTTVTMEDIVKHGFPNEVITALRLLTRKEGESYANYIDAMVPSDIAVTVKLADLQHNLSDLKPGSMRDKYELAQLYLNSI